MRRRELFQSFMPRQRVRQEPKCAKPLHCSISVVYAVLCTGECLLPPLATHVGKIKNDSQLMTDVAAGSCHMFRPAKAKFCAD